MHFAAAATSDSSETLAETWLVSAAPSLYYDQTPYVALFNMNIETIAAAAGLNLLNVRRETAAHELVHTFDVNPPARLTLGHCSRPAWDHNNCLMSPLREPWEHADGIVSLHNDPWDSSEYRRVRHSVEPMPMVFQLEATPNN